ncbi:MAG: DUF167 domain-containing protein [Nitrososphaeraceae archaeon]
MRYYVTIIFNSSDEIKLLNDNELHVPLKSKPEFGKANRELIKKLSTFFSISSECIYFISGTKSRKKIIEILK